MSKLRFDSDYMEGAHPEILRRLIQNNFEKMSGYGTDEICDSAKAKIRKALNNPAADVYFMVGGTQANATVLDALLRSYEGVLCCDTGHIAVHEAGAVEQSGHKVLTLPNKDGKLSAEMVTEWMETFLGDANHDHVVPAKAVYISHPTELGTLYTKKELEDLYQVCNKYGLFLYLDGARLSYGLAAEPEVTLEVIGQNTDAFYIGGTKCGALFGEAVVFRNKLICPKFFTIMKRHGGLLAKGWLLGIQFDTLFTDDLYLKVGQHCMNMAHKLVEGFAAKGYTVAMESPTNQQFILIDDEKMNQLAEKVSFSFWEKADATHTVIRFVTSWATTEEQINQLLEAL